MFFVYLLFQVGILQCVCRNCFKMSCVTCKAYFNAMEEISCFLWYKLRNTKRVYRHQFGDLEEGSSSSYADCSSSESRSIGVYRYNLLVYWRCSFLIKPCIFYHETVKFCNTLFELYLKKKNLVVL
jgi:hypothetical protein